MKTDRVELRPFRMEDLEDVFAYCSQGGVGEMAGWAHHRDISQSKALLETWMADENSFAIVQKASGRVIGHICAHPDSEEGRADTRELGFVLNRDFQGKGLMTEAVRQILRRLEGQGIRYVWACCFQNNVPSCRLIEKSGFAFIQEGSYTSKSLGKTFPSYEYLMELNCGLPSATTAALQECKKS